MFYKVVKDGKVVDVLDRLIYLKYQEKYDRMIFCDEEEAQAIYSSDGKHIWQKYLQQICICASTGVRNALYTSGGMFCCPLFG